MLAEKPVCAERTETGGGVGVLSNAASSVQTLDVTTHVRAAISYRHNATDSIRVANANVFRALL